jgi:hypothetical protein
MQRLVELAFTMSVGNALDATAISNCLNHRERGTSQGGGCPHVINHDFIVHVNEITSRNGVVDVVSDSVRKRYISGDDNSFLLPLPCFCWK